MILYCKWCDQPFTAKGSYRKYCCYEHYVYDKYGGQLKADQMILNYRLRQNQMDKVWERLKKEEILKRRA